MFKKLDILDEKDPHLRKISVDAKLPLSKKYKTTIDRIIKELTYSQIEEYSKKYDLRPGMGLAFPQLGINERIIVIVYEYEEGKFEDYVVINPKIVSYNPETTIFHVNGRLRTDITDRGLYYELSENQNGKLFEIMILTATEVTGFLSPYLNSDNNLHESKLSKMNSFFS